MLRPVLRLGYDYVFEDKNFFPGFIRRTKTAADSELMPIHRGGRSAALAAILLLHSASVNIAFQ